MLVEWVLERGAEVHFGEGGTFKQRRGRDVEQFFFFFFYSHLTPHSPTGMAGGKDYAGAHRAHASTYKGAAIPTPRATTTDPDKVLTQKEKQTTP